MKSIIIFILLSFFTQNINAQSSTKMLVISGWKSLSIHEGTIVKLYSYSGNTIKGPLLINDSSSIKINDKIIQFKDIAKLRVKRKGYILKGATLSLLSYYSLTFGGLLIATGFNNNNYYGYNIDPSIYIVSGGAIAAGGAWLGTLGILTIIEGAKYSFIDGRNKLSIIKF